MKDEGMYDDMREAVDNLMNSTLSRDSVEPLGDAPVKAAPFAVPPRFDIDPVNDTETLLNGLIAECHHMMRAIAIPSACQSADVMTRQGFMTSAMDLAVTGAKLGKTVAKLRGAGSITELRQRRIVEEVERTLPPPQNS